MYMQFKTIIHYCIHVICKPGLYTGIVIPPAFFNIVIPSVHHNLPMGMFYSEGIQICDITFVGGWSYT